MLIVITIIHVFVSIGLILVVLLQTGKGAEIGAVFGGSSSTIFGSSGAGNFLTRLTTGMAIVFMITSLALGYFSARRPATIFENRTVPVESGTKPAPGTPASKEKSGPSQGSATQSPAQPQGTNPEKPVNP